MTRPAVLALAASFAIVACAAKPVPVVAPAPLVPTRIAMYPRDHQGLALSTDVVRQVSVFMTRAVREQKEPAACISSFKIWPDSVHPRVDVYALTLADVDSADDLHVWYHGTHLCEDTLPSVHGHVARLWMLPDASPVDSAMLHRFAAPFGLIFFRAESDTLFGVTLYWKGKP